MMARGILVAVVMVLVLAGVAVAQGAMWWVVYGYGYPAQLISGPYYSWNQCQQVASFFNRHYLDYQYRCQTVY